MPNPNDALLAISRRAQDAAPKPQGSGGPLEDALFDIWKLAGAALASPKIAPFEVCLLTFDRISDRDWHTLVRVKHQLNKTHASMPEELRFIIISDITKGIAYLSYRTASLEEADRFRTEAIRLFDEERVGEARVAPGMDTP